MPEVQNDTQKTKDIPSKEMVKKWAQADLAAAIAFLSALRMHPEMVEKLTEEIYDSAVKGGALIDQVIKKES